MKTIKKLLRLLQGVSAGSFGMSQHTKCGGGFDANLKPLCVETGIVTVSHRLSLLALSLTSDLSRVSTCHRPKIAVAWLQ